MTHLCPPARGMECLGTYTYRSVHRYLPTRETMAIATVQYVPFESHHCLSCHSSAGLTLLLYALSFITSIFDRWLLRSPLLLPP